MLNCDMLIGYTQYGSPMTSYESRHESQTLVQPSGRYEREVKQATYSIQSSDSKLSLLCALPSSSTSNFFYLFN
jgi:hypothetical protein